MRTGGGQEVTDAERRARIGVRHALAERAADVIGAARSVTCLHATEPASVYLSAFARSSASRVDIDDALYERRSIVRQLAMRRTLFAFPADLLPAALGSASERVAVQLSTRLARDVEAGGLAGDGPAWVAATGAKVLTVLGDGPATARQVRAQLPELDQRIRPAGGGDRGVPVGPRLLSVLAAEGSVVRGRNDGDWTASRPCWTLVADWLGNDPGRLDPPTGYAELVARWLWSFGPGTEEDLTWWLGATKAAVRRALADLAARPVVLEDGQPAWLHPDDDTTVVAPPPWAALLPSLDPTTMGWRSRRFYLGPHAGAIYDRNGNGGPTAWWQGRIVGGWTQDDDGTVTVVAAEPLPCEARVALRVRAEELTDWPDGRIVRSIYQSPMVRNRTGRHLIR